MMNKYLICTILVVIAACSIEAGPHVAAFVAPYATSYNAHSVNHAIAQPFAQFVAAPAPILAARHVVPVAAPAPILAARHVLPVAAPAPILAARHVLPAAAPLLAARHIASPYLAGRVALPYAAAAYADYRSPLYAF